MGTNNFAYEKNVWYVEVVSVWNLTHSAKLRGGLHSRSNLKITTFGVFPASQRLKCHLAVSCLVPVPNFSINLKEDGNQAAFIFFNDNQRGMTIEKKATSVFYLGSVFNVGRH
ncbi:hypothetical protein DPMN_156617 [Dreissena polymorpha]|uniref:Uncharacterized protein n=1 Tax=Dreissena polymorpha TaxID=45954 RepID=A0A9D4FUN0_DREPO|nr:hypothetical protein DPMN_156617 [Dreissena polymorpha]